MADDSLPQRTSSAPARATTTPGWRQFVRRRVLHRLADRRLRRRMVLVLVTVASIGMLAAAKGLIGYYVFQQKSTRFEVALLIVGLVAGAFAIGEKRLASALEARFTRNTRKHREGLAALADELATLTDRGELERRLVARFDALFATTGTVLYIGDGEHGFAVAAHSCAESPALLVPDDPLVVRLRDSHKPVAPQDVDSAVVAPLAWPLRARGRLIGVLAAGEHEYIETFDAREVEGVTALADAAAANLALLDPALVAHAPHGTPNNLPHGAGHVRRPRARARPVHGAARADAHPDAHRVRRRGQVAARPAPRRGIAGRRFPAACGGSSSRTSRTTRTSRRASRPRSASRKRAA